MGKFSFFFFFHLFHHCSRKFSLSIKSTLKTRTLVHKQQVLDDHKAEVWSVEWNMTGTMLASTGDDGKAKVWKYAAGGRWTGQSKDL